MNQLAMSQYPGENLTLLMLYERCKTITLNGFAIGSQDSRHSNSSIVLARSPENDYIALYQILSFAECKLIKSSDPGVLVSFWVASASRFMEHPCKQWFGNPVEVWCTTPNSIDHEFIPVSNIKTPVVYTKTKFNFGHTIGEDFVYIIAPMEHNQ